MVPTGPVCRSRAPARTLRSDSRRRTSCVLHAPRFVSARLVAPVICGLDSQRDWLARAVHGADHMATMQGLHRARSSSCQEDEQALILGLGRCSVSFAASLMRRIAKKRPSSRCGSEHTRLLACTGRHARPQTASNFVISERIFVTSELQKTVTWHPHASASYALLQAITKISQWRELVNYYNFFNEMHPLAKVIPRTCLQT